jgi:site-specific recombinase XerD
MRSPADIGEEEVRTFLVHLVEVKKVSASVRKMYVAGLKFLYRVTLNRPEVVARIPWPKAPKTLLEVLSHGEVARVLGAIDSYPYRMGITTAYRAKQKQQFTVTVAPRGGGCGSSIRRGSRHGRWRGS